ncbi:MAG: pirin family protein [Chitinivorax sp.]
MITLRPAAERGQASYGWLDTKHSFSFASYYDRNHMHWGPLRVINDDVIAGAGGFDTHPHHDMEILTYVLSGALQHRDSLGTGSVIRPGEVQLMSAGHGIAHSEFNHSDKEPVHLLQIWIMPKFTGVKPGYQQTEFAAEEKRGKLRLIASGDGAEGSVKMWQDASVYAALIDGGECVTHVTDPQRYVYIHVARGNVSLNGLALQAGDGAKILGENSLTLSQGQDAEVLLFDMDWDGK